MAERDSSSSSNSGSDSGGDRSGDMYSADITENAGNQEGSTSFRDDGSSHTSAHGTGDNTGWHTW